MRDGGHRDAQRGSHGFQPPARERADAHGPARPEGRKQHGEEPVADGEERRLVGAGEPVGGDVPPGLVEEEQRAVVPDEPVPSELPRVAEALAHEAPEPAAAHLAARAIEPAHRNPGMDEGRP
jgi:hypothetical protein